MMGWREFVTMVRNCNQNNKFLLQNNKIRKNAQYTLDDFEEFYDDAQIMQEILNEYKNQYGL